MTLSQQASPLIDRLHELVAKSGSGANPQVLAAVRESAGELRRIVGDRSNVRYQIERALGWAAILFSRGRWRPWGANGAETVRAFLLADIARLRMAITIQDHARAQPHG